MRRRRGNPMNYLVGLWESIRDFLATGGDVLYVVMGALFTMWVLMIQRFWFLTSEYPKLRNNIIAKWNARTDTTSWYAHKYRGTGIAEAKEKQNARVVSRKKSSRACHII